MLTGQKRLGHQTTELPRIGQIERARRHVPSRGILGSVHAQAGAMAGELEQGGVLKSGVEIVAKRTRTENFEEAGIPREGRSRSRGGRTPLDQQAEKGRGDRLGAGTDVPGILCSNKPRAAPVPPDAIDIDLALVGSLAPIAATDSRHAEILGDLQKEDGCVMERRNLVGNRVDGEPVRLVDEAVALSVLENDP